MINDYIIKQYIADNDGEGTYLLKDAGDGDFIAKWNMNIPEPTAAQLTDAKTKVEAEKIKEKARRDLSATDSKVAGLAEALYDTLIANQVISESDISQELRAAISDRAKARAKL